MDDTKHVRPTFESRLRRIPSVCGGISLIVMTHSSRQTEAYVRALSLTTADRCFVLCCTQSSKCIKYFKKVSPQERIVVLVLDFADTELQKMIPQFARYQQLQLVLVGNLTSSKRENHQLGEDIKLPLYPDLDKPVKTFATPDLLPTILDQFISDEEQNAKEHGLFVMCNTPQQALKDVRKEMGSFVWSHTFRSEHSQIEKGREDALFVSFVFCVVLLMALPHNSEEAKQQLLLECRKNYFNNRLEMNRIGEFEREYRADKVIYWYTRACFVSNLVNNALRSKNVYALYIFRFFIFDLCEDLRLARYAEAQPMLVYRGTFLHRSELEQLRVDSLVATNGFLSSSKSREVALSFTGFDENTDKSADQDCNSPTQIVLFKIEIDLSLSPDLVVADISSRSHFSTEHELLFDLGTTFVITSIMRHPKTLIWHIEMIPCNQVAQLNREYDAYIRGRLAETTATILFGRMLAHVSEYSMAVEYFQRLLKRLPIDDEDRPGINYQLARMYRFLGKHQQAINYFQRARLLQRRQLPQNRYDYGMTLAGLGTVYLELNESKRAVRLLEEASACYNIASRQYNTETAFHFNRLSYAYYLENQYERALLILNDTLLIYEHQMPIDHPGHAQAHHNLGLIHHAMGNCQNALVSFTEALRMRERSLAPNHPYVARTCYQISLLYEEMKEYSLANVYASKALNIQELRLPAKHQEREQSHELVRRLSLTQNQSASEIQCTYMSCK